MGEFKEKYDKLLEQYNQYRQSVIEEKETQLKEFQQYRSHLDKTYKQMTKKFQSTMEEERLNNQRKINKLESTWKMKLEQSETNSLRKDGLIEELRRKIGESDKQKYEAIQESTRMLCQIGQGIDDAENRNGPHSNSYHQLARMYQLVVEENNHLKKEFYKVGKTYEEDFTSLKLASPSKKNISAKPDSSTNILNHLPKPSKKKKVGTNYSSTDQSKLHNQSVRPKTIKKEGINGKK